MKWLVSLQVEGAHHPRVVEVYATNKGDAEYRAAHRAESDGDRVVRVIRALRAA